MTTLLPMDSNDNPIPALRLKQDGAHAIAFNETSARNSIAFSESTKIVSLYSDQDVYIAFGDSAVTATTADHFFPAGVYYDLSIGSEHNDHHTHIAVLQSSSSGTLYISEKE